MTASSVCPSIPEVVVVGSAARDVDPADRRGWRLGGTAPYVGLGIARLGLRVGLILGVDAEASAAAELELLRAAGVDLHLAHLRAGPMFDNRETPEGRDQWCVAVGARLPNDALPDAWHAAPVLVLAPVAGELESAWAAAPAGGRLVALALQGVVRDLVEGQRTRLRPLRRDPLTDRADLLMLGRDDIAPGAAGDPLSVLCRAPGQRIVVSAARRGGIFLERSVDGGLAGRLYPAVPTERVRDATGAGDAFLAGWIVAERVEQRLRERVTAGAGPVPRSAARQRILQFAATVATLKMEGYGLDGMPTLEAVAARTAELANGQDGTVRRPAWAGSAATGGLDVATG